MARGKKKEEEKIHAPGTLVIVFIFLAWFIALYVLQWALLAVNWPIR
ncbi:MAG: hypothetical protein V3S82_03260 [Dehalococcoidia bacterium]